MSYFYLLHTPEYFDIFLSYSNRHYDERKEPRYHNLIERYYGVTKAGHKSIPTRGIGNPSWDRNDFANLISNYTHISDAHESLRKEFKMGMRGLKLVTPQEFCNSIQDHKEALIRLMDYRMDCIAPGAVPQHLFRDLKELFLELEVVPRKEKQGQQPEEGRKLVAVSKTLHFLLPNLVMPIDRANVLRFLGKKGDVPSDPEKQFAWFKEVFSKYIELAAQLGLKSNNGDGNWWNISVPKRIDNAIGGFWAIFNDANLERIIRGNIDMLLSFLKIP